LESALSIELLARKDGDDTEEARAMAAEGAISSNLSAELVARAADVDAEEARATAAEGVISTNLSTELVDRAAADTALQTALTNEINATNADISSIDTYLTDFVWDGTEKMTIGGAFNMVFETGLSSGDPCSVTITAK
jgi:hypothetical protein